MEFPSEYEIGQKFDELVEPLVEKYLYAKWTRFTLTSLQAEAKHIEYELNHMFWRPGERIEVIVGEVPEQLHIAIGWRIVPVVNTFDSPKLTSSKIENFKKFPY